MNLQHNTHDSAGNEYGKLRPTHQSNKELGEFDTLMTMQLGSLMIRSEEYPNVGQIIKAVKPIIEAHTQQRVVEVLDEVESEYDVIYQKAVAKHLDTERETPNTAFHDIIATIKAKYTK